jgi:proton-translocating NADH-quinone oxidoreductase chain L
MLLLLLSIPIVNVLLLNVFDYFLGKRNSFVFVTHSYLFLMCVSINAFVNIFIFFDVIYITLGTWVSCSFFVVYWGFIFDSLTVSMLAMVSIVSGCVHFYSIGYMFGDKSQVRFLQYLSLFTFFMFILVSADNFIQLFLGWEGIGLCSYLLISFWNTRIQANKSAIKALVLNRIGDWGFIFGVSFVFYLFRSVDFSTVFLLSPYFHNISISILGSDVSSLDCICSFLFIGSIGKSAQLGLHTWLPDAMEGPTPVSALIHAATLVTAGIFLVARCSPLFEFSLDSLLFVTLVGGLTSFWGATVAVVQLDIKKIIAYSTCSQLGYMAFVCGLSCYDAGIFHLINHAFFKALLFLSAGSIIHSIGGSEQDTRRYGYLVNILPYTYSLMLVGHVAIAGLPFLAGFFSKDLILELAISKYTISSFTVFWLGTLSAALTAFYSFRIVYLTFYGSFNTFKFYLQGAHELTYNMAFSLFVLSVGSILSGFILQVFFVGLGNNSWGNSIYVSSSSYTFADIEFIPFSLKILPLVFSLIGISGAIILNLFMYKVLVSYITRYCFLTNRFFLRVISFILSVNWFLSNKWYIDYIYNYYLGSFVLKYGYNLFYKVLDKGFIEIYGPTGATNVVYFISHLLLSRQSSLIYNLFSLLFCSFIFIFVFMFIC